MNRYRCPIVCPTLPDPAELLDSVRVIFAGGRVTCGEQTAAFESEVRERIGVRHAVAVSSGTSGLLLLLRALDLPAGSEVIVPSFTFAATAHALIWCGLRPVLCDCEPDTFTMDSAAAEALVTDRSSAIYPVCIFGVPGNIDAYYDLARRRGLALLFDSAQGLGSSYRGRAVGNFGAGEVFSLSPTKVVTALEGGIVTTNDNDIATRVRSMRDYGKGPDGEDMIWLGLSARMSEVNALVGRWSLAHVDEWIANRERIVRRYGERLEHLPGVSFQTVPQDRVSCRNYFVILLDPRESPLTRDQLHVFLRGQGIQTKRYFHPALHNQTLYRRLLPESRARLEVAERVAARSLALPLYSHMALDEADYICERIVRAFHDRKQWRQSVYKRDHILVTRR